MNYYDLQGLQPLRQDSCHCLRGVRQPTQPSPDLPGTTLDELDERLDSCSRQLSPVPGLPEDL